MYLVLMWTTNSTIEGMMFFWQSPQTLQTCTELVFSIGLEKCHPIILFTHMLVAIILPCAKHSELAEGQWGLHSNLAKDKVWSPPTMALLSEGSLQ
jgi:hypothetical protein